jgi:lipopolysaccharide transport system permease protein
VRVTAVPGPPSVLGHLNPLRAARGLWARRELIVRLTLQEIGQRYQGSVLGVAWSLLTPAIMLTVYTLVFSVVFQARWGPAGTALAPGEFALTLFAGLLPFGLLAEVANRAPSLVLGAPNYVKRVVFPLEILPVVATGSAVVQSLIGFAVLLAAQLLLAGRLSPAVLLLPLAYLPLVLLVLGLGWTLASLGVYLRDIGHAVSVATHVLLFLSPVFYPVEAVPGALRSLLHANPLTTVLDGFRRVALWGMLPDWGPWASLTLVSAAIALAGHAWFMQTKKGFADVM